MQERRKVVITGLGPVTPVGTGVDDFWQGLTSGRNGVRTITRFPIDDLPVTVAGEVDFDPLDHLDLKEARRTDRFTQFGIAAAKLAWADAGEPADRLRTGRRDLRHRDRRHRDAPERSTTC